MPAEYRLCRLTRPEAEHLGMSAAAAGGWIAVDADCRLAVEVAMGIGHAECLALLPASWTEASWRPVTTEQANVIAARLRFMGADETADIARRIDRHVWETLEVRP